MIQQQNRAPVTSSSAGTKVEEEEDIQPSSSSSRDKNNQREENRASGTKTAAKWIKAVWLTVYEPPLWDRLEGLFYSLRLANRTQARLAAGAALPRRCRVASTKPGNRRSREQEQRGGEQGEPGLSSSSYSCSSSSYSSYSCSSYSCSSSSSSWTLQVRTEGQASRGQHGG